MNLQMREGHKPVEEESRARWRKRERHCRSLRRGQEEICVIEPPALDQEAK